MRTFIDGKNRTWPIVINVGAAIRIRDLAGIDILQPEQQSDGRPVAFRLAADPVFLTEVASALLRPALDDAGITPEDFAESLDGKTIAAAEEAITGELRDFFAASGRIDRKKLIDLALESVRQSVLNVTTGEPSGAQPDVSESTPAPSPSPN